MRAWSGFSLGLALLSLLAWGLPTAALDWQPALVAAQPWRAFSSACVHWSAQHLTANLAGCAVLACLGWTARLPVHCTVAWLLAWPLTQLALLAQPGLLHFGGLSGVLHAGVAVAALALLLTRRGRERLIGAALALGLIIKLTLEQPLGEPLRQVAGWDIAIVPFAHLSGTLSGVLTGALCALGALALRRRRASSSA